VQLLHPLRGGLNGGVFSKKNAVKICAADAGVWDDGEFPGFFEDGQVLLHAAARALGASGKGVDRREGLAGVVGEVRNGDHEQLADVVPESAV